MDCRVLSFRQLPHQPKLFLEYMEHFEKVKTFYFHPPAMPEVTRAARKLDYPADRMAEGNSILRKKNLAFGARAETLRHPDRHRGPPRRPLSRRARCSVRGAGELPAT